MIEYLNAWLDAYVGKVRDERGLSQSTENALLVAGAVAVVTAVITVVTLYIQGKLGGLK